MVFGAYLIAQEDEPALVEMGVRDSKKLTAKKRCSLRSPLEERAVSWKVVAVPPSEIDRRSLNDIGKDLVVDLCVELRPDVLILDAPVPPAGIPAYRTSILSLLEDRGYPTGSLELIAENGADDRYPCCAASSILAKTSRDAALEEIAEAQGVRIGSGYPSDPRTVDFLRELWARESRWPDFVRTKWETARRIVAESAQGRLF